MVSMQLLLLSNMENLHHNQIDVQVIIIATANQPQRQQVVAHSNSVERTNC